MYVPITVVVMNKDARPEDYVQMPNISSCCTVDFTYEAKYGTRGRGGRASARENIGVRLSEKYREPYILISRILGVREADLRNQRLLSILRR